MKILLINGVNLNMLGLREPNIYGSTTYDELIEFINNYHQVDSFVSNSESEIVGKIQNVFLNNSYDGLIINPGAYSHYSIAILDALNMLSIPKVEVHISNIQEREEFRHVLITAKGCDIVISGEGINGYLKAIDYIKERK